MTSGNPPYSFGYDLVRCRLLRNMECKLNTPSFIKSNDLLPFVQVCSRRISRMHPQSLGLRRRQLISFIKGRI